MAHRLALSKADCKVVSAPSADTQLGDCTDEAAPPADNRVGDCKVETASFADNRMEGCKVETASPVVDTVEPCLGQESLAAYTVPENRLLNPLLNGSLVIELMARAEFVLDKVDQAALDALPEFGVLA